MILPDSIRRPLGCARRALCEAAGIPWYSRPALNDLDRKLERYLDFDGGFFVEAGANDGFTQSNTYYFERLRGWRGVLIEPIPELFERCKKMRSHSHVVQSALVGPDYKGTTIDMQFAGLMSVTSDAFGDEGKRRAHIENAVNAAQMDESGAYIVSVPVNTLSKILEQASVTQEIDLLSLDVEGGEIMALEGLNRSLHSPRFICVEARLPDVIISMLSSTHELVEVLTDKGDYQDILFRRR